MTYTLERALPSNGHFAALDKAWQAKIKQYEDDGYESVRMAHARDIVAEAPPSDVYTIYVLMDNDSPEEDRYVGFVHINHAWPRCSYATLRMNWIVLSPRYDYNYVSPEDMLEIVEGFLNGGLALCRGVMKSNHLKMHLGNTVDRGFAVAIARGFRREFSGADVSIRGNWLQMERLVGELA